MNRLGNLGKELAKLLDKRVLTGLLGLLSVHCDYSILATINVCRGMDN
ncbi:hypothetical protein PRJ_Dakar_00299 [Faustovirus]|nr:hypothetical protein PRJ_Dakar_00299 [Faustovirus]